MKNDRVIVSLALVALAVALFINGSFKYVLLGFSTAAFLIFILKIVSRDKTT
jgi:bacteriorhodopsin